MKKYMCLFVLPWLLCGCSMTKENDPSSVTERQTQECYVEEDTSVDYQDESEFLKSEFCETMRQEGHTVYSISCDAERYTLLKITSDASFYQYSYLDKETNQAVECSVSYGVDYMKHPSDAFANADDTSGDQVVTVEKDGQSYDVYIARTPYIEKDKYNIVYLPYAGYKMNIYSDAPTPDEALSYLHEFDLVPVETAAAQTVEIIEEVDYSNTVFFDTEEEFLASPFCENLKKFGYTPHHLSYDTETYELRRIRADASFYEYQLLNKETQEGIGYTVRYYPQIVGLFDMYVSIQVDDRTEDIRTTAEKNGVEYDVYLAKDHYGTEGAYRLLYLPFPHYGVSVRGNSADEALSYLHEFTLEPITE